MKILKRISRKILSQTARLKAWPVEALLQFQDRDEYSRYLVSREQFSAQFEQLRHLNDQRLVTSFWNEFNRKLEKALLPFPSWGFLRQKTISQTMVITKDGALLNLETEALRISGIKRNSVRENAFGRPLLAVSSLLSSHNSVHHAYHLTRWRNTTGKNPAAISSVIEWGGGYGNFAKLFLRQSPQATYTLIDTPLLCCLQWLYLSVVMPEVPVNLISVESHPLIVPGINIVPIGLVEKMNLGCEMFVSTWALSESSATAQDLVANRTWFGARHLLLAFQENSPDLPDAGRIQTLARVTGAQIEDVPVLKHQHYAFR